MMHFTSAGNRGGRDVLVWTSRRSHVRTRVLGVEERPLRPKMAALAWYAYVPQLAVSMRVESVTIGLLHELLVLVRIKPGPKVTWIFRCSM